MQPVRLSTFLTLTTVAVAIAGGALSAQDLRAPGPYTSEQAELGRAGFERNCQGCHMPELAGGRRAPALKGAEFMEHWSGRPAKDLYWKVRSTMPPTGGVLDEPGYFGVVAYILQSNSVPAGTEPLTAESIVPIVPVPPQ